MSNEVGGFDSFRDLARTHFEAQKSALKARKPQVADDAETAFANVVAYVDENGNGNLEVWIAFLDDATATFMGTFQPATPMPSALWTICWGNFPNDHPTGTATWQATCLAGQLSLTLQLTGGTVTLAAVQPGWCLDASGSGSFSQG